MKKKTPEKDPDKNTPVIDYQDENLMQIILDSITEGVFTIDLDKNITSFNKAAEKITGVPKEEAIGRKCYEVFTSNICQRQCALEKTLSTQEPITNLPINVLSRDGKIIPISISTAVLKNQKGEVIGAVETFRDLSVVETLRKELQQHYKFEDIISKNYKIHKIFKILPDIAESDSTILIQGPSGSGKELFAKAVHNLSFRKDGPFIVVNCGAIPETLLESELFGYVMGAFTDARKDKPGKFELANKGTIFLDEIGDIPLSLQVKLLRVLQDKTFEPLGAIKPKKADVRVIAATNKDLLELVSLGKFRDDLYYRLNVLKIELPPLSERRDDIPLLIDHFIEKMNIKLGKKIEGISHEALNLLMQYDFPGNIRELENIIEHASVLCRENIIGCEHLPPEILEKMENIKVIIPEDSANKLLMLQEEQLIRSVLKKHGGHREKTARELGIHPTTLWRKMKRYGIR